MCPPPTCSCSCFFGFDHDCCYYYYHDYWIFCDVLAMAIEMMISDGDDVGPIYCSDDDVTSTWIDKKKEKKK